MIGISFCNKCVGKSVPFSSLYDSKSNDLTLELKALILTDKTFFDPEVHHSNIYNVLGL